MAIPRKAILGTLGFLGAGSAALVYSLEQSVKANTKLSLHPPHFHWPHSGLFSTLDHASMRRGYEVYKNVCSACHGMRFMAYRRLVNETHTKKEAEAEAAEVMFQDGPDEEGEMFERPGKLSDYFKDPFPNEEAARAANNSAYPPDLSLIVRARHGKEDYIFSLLTGYCDPPAGIDVPEGQYYNPFFPGGLLSMAPPLLNGIIEYEDGTPASQSQLAKDICTFLKWSADIHFDERREIFTKLCFFGPVFFGLVWYWNRRVWSSLKTNKFVFKPPKY